MPVFFFNEQIKDPIKGKKRKISIWIKETINSHNKNTGIISIIFCSNEYLLKINQKYLNHNYYTDVITFSYSKDDIISGDIFISIEQVKENAKDLKVKFNEELLRVIIHGVLHLLGYNDGTKKSRLQMQNSENKLLEKILPHF